MCEVGLRYGSGDDSLFEESAKNEAATARGASVESEYELFQIGLQVGGGDRALMGAQNPPFEQAGDAMHTWHGDVGRIVR